MDTLTSILVPEQYVFQKQFHEICFNKRSHKAMVDLGYLRDRGKKRAPAVCDGATVCRKSWYIYSWLVGHSRGHFIMFSPLEGHSRGHFIMFSPLEGHSRGHFIMFSPLEGHPRGHFIMFSPLGGGTLEGTISGFPHWRGTVEGTYHLFATERTPRGHLHSLFFCLAD